MTKFASYQVFESYQTNPEGARTVGRSGAAAQVEGGLEVGSLIDQTQPFGPALE